LFGLHFSMVLSFAAQKIFLGDTLFLILVLLFMVWMAARAKHRKDTPPPGFVLVLLAFVCVLSGAIIALFESRMEESGAFWITLQRRLSYQGFVLLPILGIGPFILPRFFGLPNRHDFAETLSPASAWKKKTGLAAAVGLLIIGSFFIESKGWLRTAHLTR